MIINKCNHMQRPVGITQETPRGGGLDSFLSKRILTLASILIVISVIKKEYDFVFRFYNETVTGNKKKKQLKTTNYSQRLISHSGIFCSQILIYLYFPVS